MKCPIDAADLVMTDRQGVEIDYCPKCRGVWLDRGELDKLIERGAGASQSAQQQYQEPGYPLPGYGQHGGHGGGHGGHGGHGGYDQGYPRKKRKGFLGDMFDF